MPRTDTEAGDLIILSTIYTDSSHVPTSFRTTHIAAD